MEEKIEFHGIDVSEIFDYYKNKEEHKKHLKGYIYDSLVYRYQLALYRASLKDAEDMVTRDYISKKEAEAKARRNYNRDLMRFCEILDEAMGVHD